GTVLLSAVSLLFCIEGMLRGTPGAGQCAQVYSFWPLIYLVLLSGINKKEILTGLETTAVFSTAFIAVFGILFLLSSLRIIPAILLVENLSPKQELSSVFFSARFNLVFPGKTPLLFLLLFLSATAISRFKEQLWPSVTFLATVPVVLLSGRRAVQVTF